MLDRTAGRGNRDEAAAQPGEADGGPHGVMERTLSVLELLAHNARGMALSDIAERLHMPRSATHRILAGLAERNYVRQDRQGGAYQLSARLATLAFTWLAGTGITDFAQPILDRLASETDELARLATIDGRELVWVAKSQGSTVGLRYDPDMGQAGRLSCSASGHAWLSCLPEEEAIALIERQGYGKRKDFGPNAPESRTAVLKYLRAARKRGYAITDQTYTPWMNSIAVAVRHQSTGEVIGVVVVTGPHVRMTETRMVEIAPLVAQAAREMALALAATPHHNPSGGRANIFKSPGI